MNSNITVIIPIHEVQDNLENYLKSAVESVEKQFLKPDELLIVTSDNKELNSFVESFDFGGVKDITRVVQNDTGDYSFQSQINYGVSETNTEYFTFLEYDDVLSEIWLRNANKYISAYPEVGVFLPIIFECDPEGKFLSFTNQNAWMKNSTEKIGFLDNNSLEHQHNYNFDGMVVKKSIFEEFGGLKSNMKLTFTFEFLLRMTHNSVPVMVVPKLGYKHINNRPNSLFDHYKSTVDVLESRFWVNKAKKEFYFTQDREITYDVETA
jgi:GT2 family glycosyltransferase